METIANTPYVHNYLKVVKKTPVLWDGAAVHQLVGKVKAYQGKTDRGPERVTPHTGTETRARLLREAAVRNIAQ